jgi:hypothetical protein
VWYDFPATEEPKVIIEQRVLRDSGDNLGLQRIALVYYQI